MSGGKRRKGGDGEQIEVEDEDKMDGVYIAECDDGDEGGVAIEIEIDPAVMQLHEAIEAVSDKMAGGDGAHNTRHSRAGSKEACPSR